MEKNKRLIAAFNYVKSRGMAHTQKDAAKIMGATPQNFSGALKGNPQCLTDSFLRRFNEAFGSMFNLDWLLTGDGEMLAGGNTTSIDGDNNITVKGNASHITNNNNDDKALIITLGELSEMRKLLAEAIAINKEQSQRFLGVIENLTSK